MSEALPISLPNQWSAREYQKPFFRAVLQDGIKRACMVWHRRAGKDSASVNLLAVLSQMRVGTWWHCLPSFQQGRRVVWEGIDRQGRRIIEQAFPDALVESKNETNMAIKLRNGSIYQVVGSDNFDALVGTNPVGVVFSEYSLADPRAWDYVRPILAENDGIAIFIYTPRGKNHGYHLYNMARTNPSWFCELLTVNDTQAIPMTVVEEERAAGMPEDLIRQEFYCDFTAAVVGSYYADLLQALADRGGIYNFDYSLEGINTHWDIGISDSTAIWFWKVGPDGQTQIIDTYEAHGLPISHYVEVIKNKPYKYVRHWLPHDAQARTLATGTSIMEQLRDLGMPIAISPKLSIEDGIQAARAVLMSDIEFHKKNCQKGLDALEQYRREYDEGTKVFKKTPLHDWSSHFADAFRYLAISVRAAKSLTKSYESRRTSDMKYDTPKIILPTMDDLWRFNDQNMRRQRGRL
jgi:phage terminase large subunit